MLDGVITAIEEGWFQGEIADAAHAFERAVNDGSRTVVGVNRFTEGDDGFNDTLYIEAEVERDQLDRLESTLRSRDGGAVERALAAVRSDAQDPTINLMPTVIEAAKARATVGEVMNALGDVFGTWTERSVI